VQKWKVQCRGTFLGYHAIEEAAARVYDTYVKDGGRGPVKHRENISSQFKGVSWHKGSGKWQVKSKGKSLGRHGTQEAAAQAYENFIKVGRWKLNRWNRC
jgi:hypothetical protein